VRRDALTTVRKMVGQDNIVEADLICIKAHTKLATVRLRSTSQVITVDLGPFDPAALANSRARLLVYQSPFGGVTPIGIVQTKPTNASMPSATLGDKKGGTKFRILDCDQEIVILLDSAGGVTLGNEKSPWINTGITIGQGTYDQDQNSLVVRHSDVDHGMSRIIDTDASFRIKRLDIEAGGKGGASLDAFSVGSYAALFLSGIISHYTPNTYMGQDAYGVISFDAAQADGNWAKALSPDDNAFVWRNWGKAIMILKASGALYADATISAGNDWDEYDDEKLVRGMRALTHPVGHEHRELFADAIMYAAPILRRFGILLEDQGEPGRHWIDMQAATWLGTDFTLQLAQKTASEIAELRAEIASLKAMVTNLGGVV